MISALLQQGIQQVWLEDAESQKDYILKICRDVRRMKPDVVYKASGFFVPNDNYILNFFGAEIKNPDYEIYNFDNTCNWIHNLIIPVSNVAGKPVGLAGFNPIKYLQARETNDWSLNYYTYSSRYVFEKGKFLFMLKGCYEKAIREGYIILVDGFFDCLAFAGEDYNAAALLGSFVSDEIIAQLRFIPNIILAVDNDEAGLKLYNRLCSRHNGVSMLKQGKFKDADDVIKSDYKAQYFKVLDEMISNRLHLNRIATF